MGLENTKNISSQFLIPGNVTYVLGIWWCDDGKKKQHTICHGALQREMISVVRWPEREHIPVHHSTETARSTLQLRSCLYFA